jgi:hypothetical protein
MLAKVITYEGFGGARTYVENLLFLFNGNRSHQEGMVIVSQTPELSTPERTSRSRNRHREKLKLKFGEGVTVACSDQEVLDACEDANIVFSLFFMNNKWPTASDVFAKIKAPKVALGIGTHETRMCADFSRMPHWDAWWSVRPAIREHNLRKGFLDETTPHVMSCNVHDNVCKKTAVESSTERDPRYIISNTRFSTGKGAVQVLKMFDSLMQREDPPRLAAWGWSPDENGMSFFGAIKTKSENYDAWKRVVPIMKGAYTRDQVPEILAGNGPRTAPRFSIDLTFSKGDEIRWGDGGMQNCQSEAIDWGVIPIVDRRFYVSDEWDSIMYRLPEKCYGDDGRPDGDLIANWVYDELLPGWSEEKHAEMIQAGRDYIDTHLSVKNFHDSMVELKSIITKL